MLELWYGENASSRSDEGVMGNISVESDSMRSLERYSIRVMLLLMTLSAVYAAVTVMAGQGVAWASIVSAVIAFMAIPSACTPSHSSSFSHLAP